MKPTNAKTLSTQIRRVGTPVLACAQRGAKARTKATVSPSIQQTSASASPRLKLNNSIQAVHHSPARVKLVVEPQTLTLELQRPGLTVVEVQSASYKQEGDADEVELHWKRDVEAREAEQRKASMKVEAAVQRAAEECPDVRFLQVKVPDAGPGRKALISLLSLYALPAVQFYRDGQHMWEQQGQPGLERALGAGVLYFTGRGAGGEKLDDENVVKHLNSVGQLNTWLENGQPGTVQVLFVSESSGPCIRVNPAFVALARNFTSGPQPVQFGRLNLDALGHNQEAKDLVQRLNLVTAPTFMFFVQGQEQRRYVGSTAADLMGHILETVQALPAPELQQQQQHLEPAVAVAQTEEGRVPAHAALPVVASIQESMAHLLAAFATIKATLAAAVGASEPSPTLAMETAPAGTVTAASIRESSAALLAATATVKAALEAGAAPAGSSTTAAEQVAGSGHDSMPEESLLAAEAVEEVESVVNVCA